MFGANQHGLYHLIPNIVKEERMVNGTTQNLHKRIKSKTQKRYRRKCWWMKVADKKKTKIDLDANLILESSTRNTRPICAPRFSPHAFQFLEFLELASDVPSAISTKPLAIKPVTCNQTS